MDKKQDLRMSPTSNLKIGAIDLGTNSARLFIFELNEIGELKLLDEHKEMIRLGDRLYHHGQLSDEAISRAVSAFKYFREILDRSQVTELRAVATAALREAFNGHLLIEQIKNTTGISIEVITGSEEANLIARGVIGMSPQLPQEFLLIDIGGGSTELVICRNEQAIHSKSLALGAARGQQQYLKQVPPDPNSGSIDDFKSAICHELHIFQQENRQAFHALPLAIGTSGSVRAFLRMFRKMTARPEARAFSQDFLDGLLHKMFYMSAEDIKQLPELESRRIDLILAAGIILNEILKFFQIPEIEASPFALKDGLALEIVDKLGG